MKNAPIKSILDQDIYKIFMQNAVINSWGRDIPTEWHFTNRRPEGGFNRQFKETFAAALDGMRSLKLTKDEYKWLCSKFPFISKNYFDFLKQFQYDPSQIQWNIKDGELDLKIIGPWREAMMWEVPLMASISEIYFTTCDTQWSNDLNFQINNINKKAEALKGIPYIEFGTRRRRSYEIQDLVVQQLVGKDGFQGTSNIHLAHKYDVPCLGTMAHEWIMGVSALESLRHANRYAMQLWRKNYENNLSVFLPDTFTTKYFFEQLNRDQAIEWLGFRQDSGDPKAFADAMIDKLKSLGIDPLSKKIIFSDSLNVEKIIDIVNYVQGRIQFLFGIGTHLTNDVPNSKALNMVIKLYKCDGVFVVKMSDDDGKTIGEENAVKVCEWTFLNKILTPRTVPHAI